MAAGSRSRPTSTSAARRRAAAISSAVASSARSDRHSAACNVRSPLGTSVTSGRSAVRARMSKGPPEGGVGQLVVERTRAESALVAALPEAVTPASTSWLT